MDHVMAMNNDGFHSDEDHPEVGQRVWNGEARQPTAEDIHGPVIEQFSGGPQCIDLLVMPNDGRRRASTRAVVRNS